MVSTLRCQDQDQDQDLEEFIERECDGEVVAVECEDDLRGFVNREIKIGMMISVDTCTLSPSHTTKKASLIHVPCHRVTPQKKLR